jgi:hypothetical protein
MTREDHLMLMLRALAGLALGPSMLMAAIGGSESQAPLAVMAPAVAAIAIPEPRRAQVEVSFGADGKIASSALVRSTGSRVGDRAAREAALQLASLEPAEGVAGRTRMFTIALAGP